MGGSNQSGAGAMPQAPVNPATYTPADAAHLRRRGIDARAYKVLRNPTSTIDELDWKNIDLFAMVPASQRAGVSVPGLVSAPAYSPDKEQYVTEYKALINSIHAYFNSFDYRANPFLILQSLGLAKEILADLVKAVRIVTTTDAAGKVTAVVDGDEMSLYDRVRVARAVEFYWAGMPEGLRNRFEQILQNSFQSVANSNEAFCGFNPKNANTNEVLPAAVEITDYIVKEDRIILTVLECYLQGDADHLSVQGNQYFLAEARELLFYLRQQACSDIEASDRVISQADAEDLLDQLKRIAGTAAFSSPLPQDDSERATLFLTANHLSDFKNIKPDSLVAKLREARSQTRSAYQIRAIKLSELMARAATPAVTVAKTPAINPAATASNPSIASPVNQAPAATPVVSPLGTVNSVVPAQTRCPAIMGTAIPAPAPDTGLHLAMSPQSPTIPSVVATSAQTAPPTTNPVLSRAEELKKFCEDLPSILPKIESAAINQQTLNVKVKGLLRSTMVSFNLLNQPTGERVVVVSGRHDANAIVAAVAVAAKANGGTVRICGHSSKQPSVIAADIIQILEAVEELRKKGGHDLAALQVQYDDNAQVNAAITSILANNPQYGILFQAPKATISATVGGVNSTASVLNPLTSQCQPAQPNAITAAAP